MDAATINTSARTGLISGWAGVAIAYGAFTVFALLLTWPTFPDMARTWFGSSYYHHGAFVAPAALWMIAAHSRRSGRPAGSNIGLVMIVAGAALWLAGRASGAAVIEQFSFVTILIGGVGAVFGDRAVRDWAWPLAFLYFMVPAGDSLLPALQLATAKLVVGALGLSGFNVAIDGVVIETSVGAFAVAEACAGLNVLIAAVMVSAIFACAAFKSWTRRAAFIAFAAIFAIVANAVRAFFLILVPLLVGEQADIAPDHYIVGWLLYFFVLVAIAMIGRRFANRPVEAATTINASRLRLVPLAIAAGYLAAGAVYANNVIDRSVHRSAPATLSLLSAPGWRIMPPPQNWRADFPQADRRAAASYHSAGAQVEVMISYFTHDRRGAEIAGLSNSGVNENWDRVGNHNAVLYLFGTAELRSFSRLSGPQNSKFLALTIYWLGDDIYFSARDLKIAQAGRKMRGDNPEGGAVTFASPYEKHPDEAVRTLGRFTADLEQFSAWRARLARK